MIAEGNILKMKTKLDEVVEYKLPIGEQLVLMNDLVGKKIKLEFAGQINCIATGEKIKKSYNQGYSYKSFISLPECDTCIIKPELCHFAKGTCRDEKWGKEHCFIPHYVYLAVSSHVKVGITRNTQIPTRWIDQGAVAAIPIVSVENRKLAGEVEVELKSMFDDKTNWRKMLKGEVEEVDLEELREQVYDQFADLFDDIDAEDLEDGPTEINYPIESVPDKISSLSFDKKELIEDVLTGIKGQYLIFKNGVLNIRKHQGYHIKLSADT